MTKKTVVAVMCYRDPGASTDWLCKAFGFERHRVVSDNAGRITHAELKFGSGLIMIGSEFGKLIVQPDEVGGVETQSCYLVVDDIDAHYARAKAAGAAIVVGIKNDEYGGRGYTCRDPQGHVWNFGTYNPWPAGDKSQRPSSVWRSPAFMGLSALALALAVTTGWTWNDGRKTMHERDAALQQRAVFAREAAAMQKVLSTERSERETTVRVLEEANHLLAQEKTAGLASRKEAAEARRLLAAAQTNMADKELAEMREQLSRLEAAAAETSKKLEQERGAREAVEGNFKQVSARSDALSRTLAEARDELGRVKRAADAAVAEVQKKWDQERVARESAEQALLAARTATRPPEVQSDAAARAANESQEQLNQERKAREAAEKAAADAGKLLAQTQDAAKSAAAEAQKKLDQERRDKENAERTAAETGRLLAQTQASAKAVVAAAQEEIKKADAARVAAATAQEELKKAQDAARVAAATTQEELKKAQEELKKAREELQNRQVVTAPVPAASTPPAPQSGAEQPAAPAAQERMAKGQQKPPAKKSPPAAKGKRAATADGQQVPFQETATSMPVPEPKAKRQKPRTPGTGQKASPQQTGQDLLDAAGASDPVPIPLPEPR